ncbi:MAG TPA: hypothetical protein VF168_11105 [Trueperaceae bacterium]
MRREGDRRWPQLLALGVLTLAPGLAQAQEALQVRVGSKPMGEVPAFATSGFNYGNSMLIVGSEAEYEAIRVDWLRFPPGNQADEIVLGEPDLAALELNLGLLDRPPVMMVANLFEGTPQQAAGLARLTKEREIPVLAWEIGNEPDLYGSNRGDPSWTPARYCEEFRRFRTALLEVDPSYLLAGPAASGARPGGEAYLREVVRRCGDVIDILTWHIYPTDGTWTDAAALATSGQFSDEYRRYRNWAADPEANPLGFGRELRYGVTEFGLSWRSSSYRHLEDMTATLWLADVLGQMTRERLDFSSYFTLQGMGGHGLIGTGGWLRPTYHLYRMLGDFTGSVLPADAELPLRAYAVSSRGEVRLLLINHDDREFKAQLHFEAKTTADLEVTTLSESIFDELLKPMTTRASVSDPLLVPARAVILVRARQSE